MTRTRTLALVLAVAGAAVLAGGSYAFTATQAERPVDVAVASDDQAYLQIERTTSETDVLNLTNTFGSDLTEVSVRLADGTAAYANITGISGPGSLTVGETGSVTLEYAGNVSETVTVVIEARGEGVSVTVEETVTVEYTQSQ